MQPLNITATAEASGSRHLSKVPLFPSAETARAAHAHTRTRTHARADTQTSRHGEEQLRGCRRFTSDADGAGVAGRERQRVKQQQRLAVINTGLLRLKEDKETPAIR